MKTQLENTMGDKEARFESLLLATNNADLIDAYADIKQELLNVMELATKAMEATNKDLNSVGIFSRDDCNPEFLKTIDSIEENLKRKK